LYWTNIGLEPGGLFGDLVSTIKQPKDKGIMLKDILETEVDEKYYLSQQRIETMLKSERSVPYIDENTNKHNCLLAGYAKIPTDGQYIVHNTMPRSGNPEKGGTGHLSRADGKTYCLDTGNTNAVEIVAMRGRGEKGNIEQQLETNGTNKSNSLTTVTKDNLVFNYRQDAPNDVNGKKDCLRANAGGFLKGVGIIERSRIRRLTPLECERLQTVKDNYTAVASDSQRYRMLGNGWTVDVITHIFNHLTHDITKIN
jgi:DNA (cytosine-5)-methyltransferase 3A